MNGPRIAFKEWAVICLALAEGRQTILLRKGGIAEPGGTFRVEHDRFWLLPTYLHQQEAALIDSYHELLRRACASRPPEGMLRLSHLAEVVRVDHCETIEQALSLEGLHGWSAATVAARFRYREPGLHVLTVRVHRAGAAAELAETPYLLGCKSWVELDRPLPAEPLVPVLMDDTFTARIRPLEALFNAPRIPRG